MTELTSNEEENVIPLKELSNIEKSEVDQHNITMAETMKRMNSSTLEEFILFFNLHPKGNPEKTWAKVKYHVAAERNFFGQIVTYEMIYNKWQEYLNQCHVEKRDIKYIKSFEKFIDDKDYNCQFNIKQKGGNWLDNLTK